MTAPELPRVRAGRLAPSPTGGLHVGHARTFLLAWLAARGAGGRVVLRIEDIDTSRVRAEAIQGAIEDLRWLGLDWDEGPDVGGPHGPYLQSERAGLYRDALERLKRAELVYPCTCTRADVARAASAPHAEDEGPTYPGTCSGRSAADAGSLGDHPFAWRVRVPPGPVAWPDLFRGETALEPSRLGGDFLVARSNGSFGYQLAVVVDDSGMGVSQVIRGDDLLPSTPRQILLYRALGFPAPAFGHVPLVVGPDGRRLAKRDDSIKLSALRIGGVDPRRLVGVLAHSLGLTAEIRPSIPADWLSSFRWDYVPATSWAFRPELLGSPAVGDHFASV
jgi:glutamyl-tRNA synthetase